MKFTFFDIIGNLFKWKYLIALITIIAVLFGYMYIQKSQRYSAEIIIKYTDYNAAEGKTPNGAKLNVYEISSPDIVLKTLNKMNSKLEVETVRSAITISPIIPVSEVELQKSKTKMGEEYTYYPIIYSVKLTIAKSKNRYGDFCRDILDGIIDEYMVYFSETYLRQFRIAEIETDVGLARNDYIEITEVIDENLKDIIEFLNNKMSSAQNFRSPTTGYSFSDLLSKYSTIKNMDLPTIFSDILRGRITQDTEVLLKKYIGRKDNHILQANKNNEQSNLSFNLMAQYVEGNKDVPNSYNDNRSSGNDDKIASVDLATGNYFNREKTTYDVLVENYTNDGVAAIMENVETSYCENIINTFSTPPEENINKEELTKKIISDLENTWSKLRELYPLLDSTVNDYNRYIATQNIACLTGVNVSTTIPTKVYMLISAVIGVLLGVIAAMSIEIFIKIRKKGCKR